MSWQRKFVIFPKGYADNKGQSHRAWSVLVLVFVVAMVFSPYLRYKLLTLIEYPFHYKEYKHFGIRIPSGYRVHGIDVSRWQRRVDWRRVKKMEVGNIRIAFAFMKATEGSWLKDPTFDDNWENARDAGLIRGAYHYFLPNISPKDQASKFVKTVRLRSGDLPPVVDVEETRGMTKAQIQKYTKEFLNLLEKHYKIKPILYTNRDFYKRYFAGHEDFKGYRFWIAHYHVTSFDMPGDEDWHFWQHSDRGNVNGINERVDFNVFNGDSADLRRLCLP
jgi:lysozyme